MKITGQKGAGQIYCLSDYETAQKYCIVEK